MSALSDYLQEVAQERGITGPRPFGRAAGLSETTAQRLLNATAKPTVATLETVADHLGLSLAKLKRLAGVQPETEPFILPAEFADLAPEQRRVILAVGREFLRLRSATEQAGQATVTPIGGQRVTEAAWDPDKNPHMA